MIDSTQGFTLMRVFDATPEDIWSAWTDPDEVAMWWHPRGVSTPRETVAIDARAGGKYRYTMVNDATGERYPTGGVYLELSAYTRLQFTWGDPEAAPEDAMLITITLEARGNQTEMTFDLRGPIGTVDYSIHDGWDSALDVLEEFIGSAAAPMSPS